MEHSQCQSTFSWIYFGKKTQHKHDLQYKPTWQAVWVSMPSNVMWSIVNSGQKKRLFLWSSIFFTEKRFSSPLAFACLCVEQSSVIACLFIHTHKSKQTQTQLSLSPEINKSAVVNLYAVVKALEIYPGNEGTWTLINVKWWLFLQLLGPSVIWNLFRKLTLVEGWWEIVTAALILQLDS